MKCDLIDTKQYYQNHFEINDPEWPLVLTCMTLKEYNRCKKLFAIDVIKECCQTVNYRSICAALHLF